MGPARRGKIHFWMQEWEGSIAKEQVEMESTVWLFFGNII
jgi:hypothetical protein